MWVTARRFGGTRGITFTMDTELKYLTCLAVSKYSGTFGSTKKWKEMRAQDHLPLLSSRHLRAEHPQTSRALSVYEYVCISYDSACLWCNLFCLLPVYRQTTLKYNSFLGQRNNQQSPQRQCLLCVLCIHCCWNCLYEVRDKTGC